MTSKQLVRFITTLAVLLAALPVRAVATAPPAEALNGRGRALQPGRIARSRRSGWGRAGLLTLVVVLAGAQPAAAAAGELDTTFNGTGMVPVKGASPTTVAVQAQGPNAGKIVVGTSSGLVRFTTSGALDTSFGQSGTASSPYVADLAVHGDDSLVTVHGWAARGLTVRRFTSAGRADTTFDGDGSVVVPVPGFPDGDATAVATAPGGNIIVAGVAEREVTCYSFVQIECVDARKTVVARLLPSGAIDKAFGVNGIALLGGYAAFALPVDVAIRPDGSVAVATTSGVSLLRPDGRPDMTFGRAGEVTSWGAASIQVDGNGRILVAGTDYDYRSYMSRITLTRFLPHGAVDASFGTMGSATWPKSCPEPWFYCSGAASLVVVPNSHPGGGRLIVAGWTLVDTYRHLAAVAFNDNGSLDLGFGNGGSVVPGPGQAKATALTPDGKLLVAGGILYRYHLQ